MVIVSSEIARRGRGGRVWGMVRSRLASKVYAISDIGERKAFISAIVLCCAYENKRFSITVIILICHSDRRDVYTPGLANLNASGPTRRHRGGLAEEWLVRPVVRITVGHPE